MTLLIYLAIFALTFFFRSYYLEGRHLKKGKDEAFYSYVMKGKHGNIQGRGVGIEVTGIHPFIIRKERWYHRTLKSLGIAREISSGNDEVDGKLFFITDRPDHLEALLQVPGMAAHLEKIANLPIKALRCTNKRMWVDIEDKASQNQDSSYADYATTLEEFVKELTKYNSLQDRPQAALRRFLAFGAIAVHAALFTIALVGVFPIMFEPSEIVDQSAMTKLYVPICLGLAVVWLALLLVTFSGTAWVGWVLGDFLLFGLIGILLTSGFIVRQVNVNFDTSEPTMLSQPVTKKSCELKCKRSGKRASTQTYYLTEAQCAAREVTEAQHKDQYSACRNNSWFSFRINVAPWADYQKKDFSFTTSASNYDRTRIGDHYRVNLHKGYLGAAWVDTDKLDLAE